MNVTFSSSICIENSFLLDCLFKALIQENLVGANPGKPIKPADAPKTFVYKVTAEPVELEFSDDEFNDVTDYIPDVAPAAITILSDDEVLNERELNREQEIVETQVSLPEGTSDQPKVIKCSVKVQKLSKEEVEKMIASRQRPPTPSTSGVLPSIAEHRCTRDTFQRKQTSC